MVEACIVIVVGWGIGLYVLSRIVKTLSKDDSWLRSRNE